MLELEFKSEASNRKTFSGFVYTLLNIFLPVAVFLLVRYLNAPLVALLLVVLSKWRVFAVKIGYWWVNIQSNLVDFIVGVGYVGLLNLANKPDRANLIVQIILAVFYAIWLLIIKPQSKSSAVAWQAAIAVFMGFAVLFSLGGRLPLVVVVMVGFAIGYAAARHVLSQASISKLTFFSATFGFISAQLTWIYYQWTIGYPVQILDDFKIPQMAIIMTIISHLIFVLFDKFVVEDSDKDTEVTIGEKFQQILIPLVFDIAIVVLLTIVFSKPIVSNL